MTHILNNDDVEKVLTMDVCLEAVEQAFQDLGRGIAVNQLRTHTYVSLESSKQSYRLKTMNGAVPRFGVMALRLSSDIVHFPTVSGMVRQEKVPAAPGKKFVGLIQLYSLGRAMRFGDDESKRAQLDPWFRNTRHHSPNRVTDRTKVFRSISEVQPLLLLP